MSKTLISCLILLLTLMVGPGLAREVDFNPSPMLARASRMLDQGRILEGLDLYRQIGELSSDPQVKGAALVRQADILALFLDHRDLALELYDQAATQYPDGNFLANAYFNSGMISYESGRLEQARQKFQAFLDRFPRAMKSTTARFMVSRIDQELKQAAPAAPLPVPEPSPARLAREPLVRVLLSRSKSVRLEFTGPVQVKINGQSKEEWKAGEYSISLEHGELALSGRFLGSEIEFSPSDGFFSANQQRYPGSPVLSVRSGRIMLVDRLPMESYVAGVVRGEVPASFKPEALKAQAVAARTYAWYMLGKSQHKPYDLTADTDSQVFAPTPDKNLEGVDAAVQATRGRMLTDKRGPILAYYHSHSGGALEDDVLVWTADLPYYSVREDSISEQAKPMSWEYSIRGHDLAKILRTDGFKVYGVSRIEPARRSPSGRVMLLRLETDQGAVTVKGDALRMMIGPKKLKSTLFEVEKKGDKFVFQGKGYGHGVGMSQWGAQGLAGQGKNYQAILTRYYPGARLEKVY